MWKGKLVDGWLVAEEFDSWPGHRIKVRAEIVDGEPRVTSLVIEKVEGGNHPAITGNRLRSLPVHELARLALRIGQMTLDPGIPRALAAVARRRPPTHDPRAVVTVEQVAEVWNLAREAGRPARTEVVQRLGIGARTADRYVKKARAQGLIISAKSGRATERKGKQSEDHPT